MNNKLKNIKLANILLEQKYLREQANSGVAQTGTTSSQAPATPPQSGQTQVSTPTPQSQSTTLTTDQKEKIIQDINKNAIMKCGKGGLPLVATYKNKNIHSLENNSFCIG
jgi:hypothetical protein